MTPDPTERPVICDGCGEVLYTEPIGGPDDPFPALGDATRFVEPEECALCNDGEASDDG